ncbi:glucose-6-phosphate isomerase [Cyanobacterium aponinum FACHB-4101]|uniref:Glucose-6-phosphate isomerase n=1 Tax=Cyanobacterium aponinum 0216 TaxID=2676140 RepID=A0A844GYI6_9CHRO|nr:glucose-6-phosphate isomerase [Cyanobacterium aponinum]MBD2393650.1 glucose-6-phosphate isomerase [Cyanobacterium aponinum FACHB-4101]MTF39215.1 glucose-6-phosphate isomerase [Cyanobacterium aponinum 0216]
MDNLRLWQRYQDWLYYHPTLDLYVDVSRMGFDDSFYESMLPKFAVAFESVAKLEQGAIANPDEKRMVGHYWLRNTDIAPNQEIKREIEDCLVKIKDFTQKVHSGAIKTPFGEKFTDLLSIGIGGSALGPQFVSQALADINPQLKIHFIDNTDPDGIDRTLTQIKDRLKTTLVLVISKSGGTPETRNGMLEAKHAYEKQGLNFARQAVAITMMDDSSKLYQIVQEEDWLDCFPMFDWVGGRTSELSSVGLLPAALEGIDIDAMLAGAKEMDIATRETNVKNNPSALLALSWYYAGNGRGEKDMVMLPYKDSLLLFSRYLQQLVMESLGKEKDLDGNTVYQGIAVYGNKGSTDQHAYVQQLREGIANFFVTFIEVLKDRENKSIELEKNITSGDYLSGLLQGTRQALYDNGRDSITVTVNEVTPYTVGALIALYERAVSIYAYLVNINAYHQPGVEAGKKAAASILALQKEVLDLIQNNSQSLTIQEIADKIDKSQDIEAIYKILRHLSANNRGIHLEGDRISPSNLQVKYMK